MAPPQIQERAPRPGHLSLLFPVSSSLGGHRLSELRLVGVGGRGAGVLSGWKEVEPF